MTEEPTSRERQARLVLLALGGAILFSLGLAAGIGGTNLSRDDRPIYLKPVEQLTDAEKAHNQTLVEGGYRLGRYVGRIQGSCDTIQRTVNANPDSEYAQRPSVTQALTACDNLPADPVSEAP